MTIRSLGRLVLLAVLVSVAYAGTARADEELYNCCGNEEGAVDKACRYTNRNTTCSFPADCKGDEYGTCCPDGCFKMN